MPNYTWTIVAPDGRNVSFHISERAAYAALGALRKSGCKAIPLDGVMTREEVKRSSMQAKEPRLREMAALNWSQWRMGEDLGLSASTISKYLTLLNIPHAKNVHDRNPRKILKIVSDLRSERMAQGLTMREFARRTGWDRSLIGEWERGKRRIHGPGLMDCANALGLDVVLVRQAP